MATGEQDDLLNVNGGNRLEENDEDKRVLKKTISYIYLYDICNLL